MKLSDAPKNGRSHGHLMIIGGAEDREGDKRILKRFLELAGGRKARIVVLTAATVAPKEMWELYDKAFRALGAEGHVHLRITSREEASDPANAKVMLSADGVFMTGGDQKRLLAVIGGTRIDDAMHRAFHERSACIAGTSAGASAIAEHMFAASSAHGSAPEKGESTIAAGLGFLQRVVIDQHFSERQRLTRLLEIVAQNPYLLGVGIDEDTALIVENRAGFEVIGKGMLTLLDGRQMSSNFLDVGEQERLELINVKLHLLPAGGRYYLNGRDKNSVPQALRDAVAAVINVSSPPIQTFA